MRKTIRTFNVEQLVRMCLNNDISSHNVKSQISGNGRMWDLECRVENSRRVTNQYRKI